METVDVSGVFEVLDVVAALDAGDALFEVGAGVPAAWAFVLTWLVGCAWAFEPC
ncbi:hypothetical protein RP726_10140 [Candidatus Methylospira mobilis]|uniref:hypothetical protein n=1 Tax=Candidatus Methylospira mobilis TaxID=1808979 RepID=UPI001884C616|nr:hypothetical protein [Candidatus Methylospira mobilis]WNV06741.1 hypothetical protein RP726_10140 [Candidatus Methylospira mobilis]